MQKNTRLLAAMEDPQKVGGARVHNARDVAQRYVAWLFVANDERQTKERRKQGEREARKAEVEMRKFLTENL